MQAFSKPTILFNPQQVTNTDAVFSIVIPSWNNLAMLQFCIAAIHKNSHFKHQIIIHVNEGTDGTLEWVKQQGFDYTHSAENAGVCYAMNAMVTLAKTDYILFLNDDMYVCPNWDLPLWNEVKKQSDNLWYFSGTMIEPTFSGNKCAIAPFDFGNNPTNFKEKELLAFIAKLQLSDWFGASWPPSLVHKTLFNKIGGYSEEFSPGMYSDPDFSMKLWNAGVRNFKGLGNSLVYHFQSKSTGRVVRNDGRKQFAAKWGVPSSYFYKHVLLLGEKYEAGKLLAKHKNVFYYVAKLRALWISK
ncbi:MAG: glycosyltransferase [Bacteroidota bacterium]